MSKYSVIYEHPDYPDEPVSVLTPSDEWLSIAMSGGLPPITVFWELQDDEQKFIDEGKYERFSHDDTKWKRQFYSPRIGKLTEEEAMEYLIMKDIPRRVWSVEYNRPMFKIVRREQVPTDRRLRDSWEMTQ